MLTRTAALQVMSAIPTAQSLTRLPTSRVLYSSRAIPTAQSLIRLPTSRVLCPSRAGHSRMLLTSDLAHQDGPFHEAASRSTPFSSPVGHNRRTNPAEKSGFARARYCCVGQSWKRRLRSTSRRCGGRIRYERQRSSTTLQWAQEQKEISLGPEEGNSERSYPGRERRSIIALGGTKFEVRLLQRLHQTLKDRHLSFPGQKILLAVSGGQDSVCLMHLLVKLQNTWGWKIGIAHCDHQWSSSARDQAAHVARMALGLGLDYYQALTIEGVPGEGAARTWRYGVLQRIAVCHGYEAIVTAHTGSDRVETSLFNIFRGTGLQGLQSLAWKRSLSPGLCLSHKSTFSQLIKLVDCVEDPQDSITAMSKKSRSISLVRPLLDVTRTELRELWEELELPLWPDPSNTSLDIDRNRIRHQLLPYLRKYFNSGVDKSLARWAEIVNREHVYLDSLCANIRATAVLELREPEDGKIGKKLDVPFLLSLPIALQRRIVKQFSDSFTGKSLGFDTVERVRQTCGDASSRKKGWQVSVPGNCYLLIRGDDLIVGRSLQRGGSNLIGPKSVELSQKLAEKPKQTE